MRRKTSPPPGQRIDVGGFRLHLYCSGSNDNNVPTVLIEAGCGCSLVFYTWLQKKLSQKLRVCSYDRAGLGWSEESHQPRDAEHIADQLHTLLSRSGIEGPIILVGHSIAGLYLRLYANKYPDNIAGMVLLDSSHPKQNEVLAINSYTLRLRLHNKVMAIYASLGLAALCPPLWELKTNDMIFLPECAKQQLAYLFRFRQSFITPSVEFDAFESAAKQVLASGDLGDLPLLVITAPVRNGGRSLSEEQKRNYASDWMLLQKDLLTISSRSQHKIIAGAGHCTLLTKAHYAEEVAADILLFIKQIS